MFGIKVFEKDEARLTEKICAKDFKYVLKYRNSFL